MMVLPLVFLCNTVLFALIMNNRFKAVTTAAVSAAAYILSIILNAVLSPAFDSADGYVGIILNSAVLLVAGTVLYTNNLVQKLFAALLMCCNYTFLFSVTEQLFGVLPFGNRGFGALLTGIIVYLLFSILTIITLVRPMQYFSSRGVSTLSVGLCVLTLLCWVSAAGKITDMLGVDVFAPRFFITLFIYAIMVFAIRSAYNAAKFKERECRRDHRDALLQVQADYFNSMVGNVTNAKTAREHHDYVINEITNYARQGNCDGVLDAVADQAVLRDPFLDHYSDNPYINAVIAAKTAYARHCGVRMESNIELGNANLKTVEFCVILNDILAQAIENAEKSHAQDKSVRMTVLPMDGKISFEAVYSASPKRKKKLLLNKNSFTDIVKSLFEPEIAEGPKLEAVRGMLERNSGTMNISSAGSSEILKVVINN